MFAAKGRLIHGDLTPLFCQGADGVCIVKTNQAILVGMYKEGIQPGQCTKVVEGLADYLINVGYVSVSGPAIAHNTPADASFKTVKVIILPLTEPRSLSFFFYPCSTLLISHH